MEMTMSWCKGKSVSNCGPGMLVLTTVHAIREQCPKAELVRVYGVLNSLVDDEDGGEKHVDSDQRVLSSEGQPNDRGDGLGSSLRSQPRGT